MLIIKSLAFLFLSQVLLFTGTAYGAHYDEIFTKLKKETQHIKNFSGLIVNGYHTKRETLPCKQHITKGAMGYHLRKDWKMDKTFNPAEPEEPMIDTNGNLVGAEYVVYGDKTAVEMLKFFHLPYTDGTGEGDVKVTVPSSFEYKGKGKYELHVWVWKKNPKGPFMHYNPEVSCKKANCRLIVLKDGSKKFEGECSQLSQLK